MCVDPVTATMMGLSAAQGVTQYQAQKQQAEQQKAAQDAASIREMQRQQMSMRAERIQQADEETTLAQEQLKADREAQEAVSTTAVAAETVNAAGTSVGLNLQDFERKNAEYQAALALQERMNDTARRLSLENKGQQYVSRMIDINQPIARPDFLGTALQTASTMFGQYQTGRMAQASTEASTAQRDLYSAQQGVARQNLLLSRQQTATSAAQMGLYQAQRLNTN